MHCDAQAHLIIACRSGITILETAWLDWLCVKLKRKLKSKFSTWMSFREMLGLKPMSPFQTMTDQFGYASN